MTKILIAANLVANGEPTMLPQFKHDCDKCVFLGRDWELNPESSTKDIWFCPSDGSLVMRFSSEGPEYQSFPLTVAVLLAKDSGPGSDWSEAVSRYDDWHGVMGNTASAEVEDEDDGYETIVGLYLDLKVKLSEKGKLFFRDLHGNPLGIAYPVNEDTWEFRPEEMDGLEEAFLRPRQITGRKALNLYVMLLLQLNQDIGG